MIEPSHNTRSAVASKTDAMAAVLEARHGAFAADVASFFASFHEQVGDTERSRAWHDVADTVRRRENERLCGFEF